MVSHNACAAILDSVHRFIFYSYEFVTSPEIKWLYIHVQRLDVHLLIFSVAHLE